MNLRSIDLNLLVVLRQLLEDRHVTKAAEQLNMSQPAVSRALQRLRELFADELLVKTANSYALSARAEELLPQLNRLLDSTEQMIIGSTFDPAESVQTVKFYGSDPHITEFLPPLFAQMREHAPHMKLEAYSDPRDHFDLLESGDIHFVISSFQPTTNTDQYHYLVLSKMELAIVMREDHPLAHELFTLENYLAEKHGAIALTGRGPTILDQKLTREGKLARGEQLDIALRLTSFTAIARFCEQSDILFHLPKHFAQQMARGHKLIVRDTLPELKPEYDRVYLYWHARYHNDPMCIWIREQLKQLNMGSIPV